jgi:citrate lyase subunit beta/citryl-CoA lyase/(3S)-malyl-CoA thioesterase
MTIRSALFIPCANARAMGKARELKPDMIIFDLEDAVSPSDRETAAAALAGLLRAGGLQTGRVLVRIHPPSLNAIHHGLAGLPIDGLVVPKVDGPDDLRAVAHVWPGVPLWAMIETAKGVARLADIAAEPVAGLIAGPNDLRKDLRARPLPERADIAFALSQIVLYARAHGLIALDGVFNHFNDDSGFDADCMHGRALGFDGKTLIHPAQIEPCHRAFSPSDGEIAWAQSVVAAFDGSAAAVVSVHGEMVERLHLAEAQAILATV